MRSELGSGYWFMIWKKLSERGTGKIGGPSLIYTPEQTAFGELVIVSGRVTGHSYRTVCKVRFPTSSRQVGFADFIPERALRPARGVSRSLRDRRPTSVESTMGAGTDAELIRCRPFRLLHHDQVNGAFPRNEFQTDLLL